MMGAGRKWETSLAVTYWKWRGAIVLICILACMGCTPMCLAVGEGPEFGHHTDPALPRYHGRVVRAWGGYAIKGIVPGTDTHSIARMRLRGAEGGGESGIEGHENLGDSFTTKRRPGGELGQQNQDQELHSIELNRVFDAKGLRGGRGTVGRRDKDEEGNNDEEHDFGWNGHEDDDIDVPVNDETTRRLKEVLLAGDQGPWNDRTLDDYKEGLAKIDSTRLDQAWDSLVGSRKPINARDAALMQDLRDDPKNPYKMHALAAFLEMECRELAMAEEALKLGCRLHPSDASFIVALGDLSQVTDPSPRAAEALYMHALQVDPGSTGAMQQYASLLVDAYDDIDGAKEVLARGIQLFPGNAGMHGTMAHTYEMSGEVQHAEEAYDRALQVDPGDPATINNYAALLYGAGRGPEAMALYEKGMKLRPSNPTILYNFGLALEEEGDAVRAEKMYRQAIECHPQDCDALCKLGWLLHTLGDGRDGEAVELLGKALLVNPSHHAAVICSVRYHLACGDGADEGDQRFKAEQVLLEASIRRPSDPVILREYARFHEVTDNLGGAEAILRRARKASPADLDIKADLGRILCFRCEEGPTVGDRLISAIKRRSKGTMETSPAAEAHSLFGEVLREDPDHGHALKSYARFLYLVESDLVAAEQLYRKAVSVDPEDTDVQTELADLLYAKGGGTNEGEAGDLYRSAVALDKDAESRSDLLFEYGCNLMEGEAGDVRGAAEQWELAMKANPRSLAPCFNLALAKFGFGEYEESEVLFLNAQSLDPQNAGVLYQLGRLAEEHRDDQQEALRLFEKASLSDPTLSDAICRYARLRWRVQGDEEGAGVLLRAAIEGNASQALASVGAGGRGGFESMAERALASAEASEGSAGREVKHPKEPSLLHSQSYFEYGVYLEEAKKEFPAAIEMYRHAVDTGGRSLGLLMRCGELMCRVGGEEADEGIKMLELTVRMVPSASEPHLLYSEELLRRGWSGSARKHLLMAQAIDPGCPRVASLLERAGEREEDESMGEDEGDMKGLGEQVPKGVIAVTDGGIELAGRDENECMPSMEGRELRITACERGEEERKRKLKMAKKQKPTKQRRDGVEELDGEDVEDADEFGDPEVDGGLDPGYEKWLDMNTVEKTQEPDPEFFTCYAGDESDEAVERKWAE